MKLFNRSAKIYDFIYFCAAYNDVLLSFTLINREEKKCHLIVLFDLNYDITLFQKSPFLVEFIKLKNINLNKYYPHKILSGCLYSRYVLFKYFRVISKARIYFFSEYYNVLLFSLIFRLQKRHEIVLGIKNHENYVSQQRGILEKYIIKGIYGMTLNRYSYSNNNNILGISCNLGFNYNLIDESIKKEEIRLILDLYSANIITDKSFLLFLESDIDYIDLNFQKSIHFMDFWKLISQSHNCYVKSHPRFENSDFSKGFQLNVIDKNFPVEFINLINCKAVVGFSSFALVNLANKGYKVISLIELFEYNDETHKKELKDYLESFSSNRILYPKTFSDFKSCIN